MEPNALVVDDRNESREMVAEDMARAGFRITEASNGVDGWQRFQNCRPDLVVSDLTMPGAGGIDLLKRIREVSSVPVILFSATGDVRAAVEAIKAGAQEFYRFPTDRVRMMDRAQALASGRSELSRLESQLLGSSSAMRRVRERVCALAPLRVPVLVSGDSGTGRDRVVRCLADLASGQFSRLVKVTRETAGDVRQPDRQIAYYLDGFDAFLPADQVRWLDAVGDSGWMQLDKAMASKPAAPVSLGYKLLHTKEKITIFTDYIIDDEDGSLTVGNVTTIPAAWVQEVTEIIFTK